MLSHVPAPCDPAHLAACALSSGSRLAQRPVRPTSAAYRSVAGPSRHAGGPQGRPGHGPFSTKPDVPSACSAAESKLSVMRTQAGDTFWPASCLRHPVPMPRCSQASWVWCCSEWQDGSCCFRARRPGLRPAASGAPSSGAAPLSPPRGPRALPTLPTVPLPWHHLLAPRSLFL